MTNDIYHLFLKVVETGSISKAASELYISQPALSQQLKKLEKEFNTKLLVRSNKGIELTEEGKIVFKYFMLIKDCLQEMEQEIEDKQNNILKFKISAVSTVCNYSLPCVIYHLKKHYPNVIVELSSRKSSLTVEEELLRGRCDIGFITGNIDNSDVLIKKKIFEEKIVLAASNISKTFPDSIKIKDLSKYDLIRISKENETVKIVSKYINNFENYKFTYNLESMDSIKSCVINGYGMAFLPYTAIKKELYHKEIKIVNIESISITQEISMIKRAVQTDGLKRVINYMEKYIKKIIC